MAESDADAVSTDEIARRPAPDVSHIIIEHLQKENEKLRGQVAESKKVEITGDGGSPVYATGSIGDGRWRNHCGGLWEVGVEMTGPYSVGDEEPLQSSPSIAIPISALEGIEIRLGGVLYASVAASPHICALFFEYDWDNQNGKQIILQLGGFIGVWLPLRVTGWPQHHWSQLQELDYRAARTEGMERPDVYAVLSEQIPELFPRATMSFGDLAFFGNCLDKMLKNFELGQLSEEEKARDADDARLNDLIAEAFRSAGCNDLGRAFATRMSDVTQAAYMMKSQEAAEGIVSTLVEMQLNSDSTDDFLAETKERYASILGDLVSGQSENEEARAN